MRINLKIISLLILIFVQTGNAQKENKKDPTTWKYFTIYIDTKADPSFLQIGKELELGLDGIDEPDFDLRYSSAYYKIGCKYKLLVDIRDTNESYNYCIIGNYYEKDLHKDYSAQLFAWFQLTKESQNKLINWKGSNKIKGNDTIAISNKFKSKDFDINNPGTWRYFKILARIEDNSLFLNLQEDLGIKPVLKSYTIVVNISDPNPQNQYVVFGDELDPSAQRFEWSKLSNNVQNGLLNWTGTNKLNALINLEDLEIYNCAIDMYGNSRNIYYIYYLRGVAYSRADNNEKAMQDFNKSIELYPLFEKSFFERGKLNSQINKYLEAINDYTKSIQFDPINPNYYEYRGFAYYYGRMFSDAIADWEKAIELKPSKEKFLRYFINEANDKIK